MSHYAPLPLAAIGEDQPSCTLWQVRLLLGRGDHSDDRFVRYVQALVDECGFPRPFPSVVKGSATRKAGLTLAVTPRSTFRRDAVLAWRDDYLPPACSARLDAEAMRCAAAEMDAAAGQLGNLRLAGGTEA